MRDEEVAAIRRTQLLGALAQFLVISLPSFVCVGTFVAFATVGTRTGGGGGGRLTAARVFTSLALLGLLSSPLARIPTILTSIIGMLVNVMSSIFTK